MSTKRTVAPPIDEQTGELPDGIYLTKKAGKDIVCGKNGEAIANVEMVVPRFVKGKPPSVMIRLTPTGFIKADGTAELY